MYKQQTPACFQTLTGEKHRRGYNVVIPMANLNQFLQGYYKQETKNQLTPVNQLPYRLEIRESKTPGRLPYLCAFQQGNYKPLFISSIYEPRTPGGVWNIEYNRVRYEATETSPGIIYIYQVSKPAKRKML